jgi:hypothetical protein
VHCRTILVTTHLKSRRDAKSIVAQRGPFLIDSKFRSCTELGILE